jgi:hypothetical protein
LADVKAFIAMAAIGTAAERKRLSSVDPAFTAKTLAAFIIRSGKYRKQETQAKIYVKKRQIMKPRQHPHTTPNISR